MSFNIAIRVDSGDSVSTTRALTAELGKAEAAGPRVGKALSTGFREAAASMGSLPPAMRAMAAEVERLASVEKESTSTTDGMYQATSRVQVILKEIRGPLIQYQQDLTTLGALLRQGAINEDEYARAVGRRSAALDKSHPGNGLTGETFGPTFDPAKAGQGGGGAAADGMATSMLGVSLSVGAAVGAFKELASAIIDSQDAYTNLTNSVRKYADASHSAEQIVKEMQGVSLEIHATTEETIGLYDRVKTTTADLYLTELQRVDITKTLGLVAKENNRSIESVEAAMKKLAYATEVGSISTRELKAIFNTMPELSLQLADSFGMHEKAFVKAMTNGKISAQDFYEHIAKLYPAAAKKIEDFTLTNKEQVREWVMGTYNGVESMKTEYQKWIDVQHHAHDVIEQTAQKVRMAADAQEWWNDKLAIGKKIADDFFTDGFNDRIKQFHNAVVGLQAKADLTGGEKLAFGAAAALGGIDPVMMTQIDHDATKSANDLRVERAGLGETTRALVQTEADHTAKIKELTDAEHNAALTTAERARAHTELASMLKKDANEQKGLRSELEKMEEKLLKPFKDWKLQMEAVDLLLKQNKISTEMWREEHEKLLASDPAMHLFEASLKRANAELRELAEREEQFRKASGGESWDLGGGRSMSTTNGPGFGSEGSFRDDADPLRTGYQLQNKYARDAADARAGYDVGSADRDKAAEEHERRYQAIIDQTAKSVDKFAEDVSKLNQAEADGVIGPELHAKALEHLRNQFNTTRDPMKVLDEQIKEQTELYKAMGLGAEDLERKLRALREAAHVGTFGDGVTDGLEKIKNQMTDVSTVVATGFTNAFKAAEDAIVVMVTTGKVSFDSLAKTIEADLVRIALRMAESQLIGLFASSAGGGSVGAAAAAITGGAHANGGSYTAGVDTVPYLARLSPGETFHVTSAQGVQRGEEQSRGDSHHYNITYNAGDRYALPAMGKRMDNLERVLAHLARR